jgi:cation diffusion facilitator CzcD-associated flavoprotein CzcO
VPRSDVDVLVVGAGFGGLGIGIQLKRRGRGDFVIVEQDAGVGGTWWANRYPGAACDIPSLLYSFSFAPNPDWTRHYPPQPEIAAYLAGCVDRFGLAPHLRLSTRLVGLDWNDAERRWCAQLEHDGRATAVSARVVVAATGGLSRPALPALEGLADFTGIACHTARWDDRIGTRGQRVGVIGTGASAIQLVPQLVARGAQVSLFQRTPPWILPRRDHAIAEAERARRARWPLWQRAQRCAIWLQHESRVPAFTRWSAWVAPIVEPRVLRHLHRRVPPGPLRDALTPHYRIGCKRILISDDFYPAMLQPNARLVTTPVTRLEAAGVRTADGTLHTLDALVLATGFEAAETREPRGIRGRGRVALDDAWRDGAQALLGASVPGFPNLFFIVGPNTGLGHNSMVLMIEAQIRYVLDALDRLDRAGAKVAEARPDAFETFNAELRSRLARTVWASGCTSWYQTKLGRITTLWPGSTIEFRRRTRRFDPRDYRLS